MSDHDFDAYLSLLARFLRLSPRQREDIRRELRAHLEESIEEQTSRGVPRDLAIQRALEDFGDAAELAGRFSNIGRRRRWIMKGTAAAACVGLAAFVFNGSTGRLVWDAPQTTPAETAAGAGAASRFQSNDTGQPAGDMRDSDARIRAALARQVEEVAFEATPLGEVVAYLTELMGVNVHVQWARLEDFGAGNETPISLKLRGVTVERVWQLVLNEIREVPVDYMIEDGVLLISTREGILRNLTTRVYDVRDLLGAPPSVGGGSTARIPAGVGGSLTSSAGAEARRQGASSSDVNSALNSVVPHASIQDQPLEMVLDWLTELSGINLIVEWEDLSQNGVERDTPISLSLRNLPLGAVLAEVLRKAGRSEIELGYAVEDGLLRIATRARLLRTIDSEEAGMGTSGRDEPSGPVDVAADELVAMIQRSLAPWSWESNGAENAGHLEVYRGLLIVRTAGPIHEKLAGLLNEMRAAAGR